MTTAEVVKRPHYTRTRRAAQWKAEQVRRAQRRLATAQSTTMGRALLAAGLVRIAIPQ
jgi:hypothetical protein